MAEPPALPSEGALCAEAGRAGRHEHPPNTGAESCPRCYFLDDIVD